MQIVFILGRYFIQEMLMKNQAHSRIPLKTLFILLAGMIFLTLFYIETGMQKQDFHTDESYTFQLANSAYGPWWVIPENEWFSPAFLLDQMVVQPNGCFDYSNVIEHEKYDLHPFIYTAIIHTVCSFFPGQVNMWMGIGVNIFFALLCIYYLFQSFYILSQKPYISIMVGLTFGASFGLVNQIVFIRMYVVTMFLAVFTIYLHLKNWEGQFRFSFFLPLYFISVLGALTHYYYIVFLFFCCVVFFLVLLYRKDFRSAFLYFLTELAAGISCLLIFPSMLNQILGGAAIPAGTSQSSFASHLLFFLRIIDFQLFSGVGAILILCIFFYLIMQCIRIRKADGHFVSQLRLHFPSVPRFIFLLFPCLMFILLTSKTAPYLTDRYVATLYPVIWLSIAYFIWACFKSPPKNQSLILKISAACITIFIAIGYWRNDFQYLYQDRSAILSQTDTRTNRAAVLLIPDNIVWPIPSALSELISYEKILVVSYNDFISDATNATLLLEEEKKPINVYCYNYGLSDHSALPENAIEKLKNLVGGERIQFLWDSYYSTVYEIQ